MKQMMPVMVAAVQIYVDLDCGEATAWGAEEVKEYGPIEEQGCDRCESGQARWVKVYAEQEVAK